MASTSPQCDCVVGASYGAAAAGATFPVEIGAWRPRNSRMAAPVTDGESSQGRCPPSTLATCTFALRALAASADSVEPNRSWRPQTSNVGVTMRSGSASLNAYSGRFPDGDATAP